MIGRNGSTVLLVAVCLGARLAAEGRKVETLELHRGDLRVVLRDNARSPAVLSGVQSLFHAVTPDFDAFDPDARGASAGLNFEHIIAGHHNPANKFSPRHGRYDLYALEDGRSAALIRRREDSPWDVSSSLTYTLAAPHAIDIAFRATPHSSDLFGRRGHAIFFFASYMNDVEEVPIRFRGIESADAPESWIAADAPEGQPDWNGGGTYRHRDARTLAVDDELEFRLNSWSYDYPRYTQPFYYGRAARGMVLILMFDRAHTPDDEIRFSLFKFKLPRAPRPAWDFQYVIHRVVEGREYGFRARLVWKEWVSPEDCLAEYSRWAKSLEREAASGTE